MKRFGRIAALLVFVTLATGQGARVAVASMTDPGDLDVSFGGDGWVVRDLPGPGFANQVLIQQNGNIIVAGTLGSQFAAWRFLPNGDTDLSFGGDGEVTVQIPGRGGGGAHAAAIQLDGRIVLVGYRGASIAAVRLLPDGSLDPAFGGGDGMTKFRFSRRRAQPEAVELLPDGRMVIGSLLLRARPNKHGTVLESGTGLALLSAEGLLDATFGSGGRVREPVLFRDLTTNGETVVVVGQERRRPSRFVIGRYGLTGTPDPTLGGDGLRRRSLGRKVDAHTTDVLVDSEGRIVVAITGYTDKWFFGFGTIARLNHDGSWDGSFSEDGVAKRYCCGANAVVIQEDGDLLISGEVFAGGGSGEYHPMVRRLLPDGGADETFGDGGSTVSAADPFFWSSGVDLLLQQDGKVVFVAPAIFQYAFGIARLLTE